MKTIDTLVQDIYKLLENSTHITEASIDALATKVSLVLKEKLLKSEYGKTLRPSNLGTPNRKLWYSVKEGDPPPTGQEQLKFIYGDIIEALIIWLAEEAGHEVTDFQKTINNNGIKGSLDCKIDGVLVDVKSASPYSFKKFKGNSVTFDDPFGYLMQLSTYYQAEKGEDIQDEGKAGWIAVNKVDGEIAISLIDSSVMPSSSHRIEEAKKILESDTPPEEKCYPEEPYQKSGNMQLAFGCGFCPHKHKCWPGLRTFVNSQGRHIYLTKVVKEPKLTEVT